MKRLIKIFSISFYIYTLMTPRSFCQLVPDFRVNDDLTGSSFNAVIAVDHKGNYTISWEQLIVNRVNVFAQRFNSSSQPLGKNFQVNNIQDTSGRPAITVSKQGSIIISWSHNGVFCRLYDKDGNSISSIVKVNDSAGALYGRISIDSDSAGNFVITWDHTFGSPVQPVVYFQRFDSLGNRIGINKKVSDFQQANRTEYPSITIRDDKSFIITWIDDRGPEEDVFMQIFNENGIPMGANVQVNENNIHLESCSYPSISSDSLGRFVVVYNLYDATKNESYAKMKLYYSNGLSMANSIIVSSNSFLRRVSKKEDGSMVLSYNRNFGVNSFPFFVRYDSAGNQIGQPYLLTPIAMTYGVYYEDVTVFNNKIMSTMSEDRKGNRDIFCNVRSFNNPDSTVNIIQTSSIIPIEYQLYQNYPNPFNPQTTIRFDNRKSGRVKLIISDMLGQKVKTLIDEFLRAGSYEVIFNCNSIGLSSGSFIYSLITEDVSESKIMILNK